MAFCNFFVRVLQLLVLNVVEQVVLVANMTCKLGILFHLLECINDTK